nr:MULTISPECIES: hypothetical protein [unclassified Arthrobacter]
MSRAETLFGVNPMMGATAAGFMASTSLYQSTACQRLGRDLNASTSEVASKASR